MALRALLGSGHDSVAGIRGGHAYICAMLLALDMLLASHDRQPGRARQVVAQDRPRLAAKLVPSMPGGSSDVNKARGNGNPAQCTNIDCS